MRFPNPPYISHSVMIANEARKLLEEEKLKKGVIYVEKDWGYEIWFANTNEYCGKELFIKRNKWSSKGKYHFHKIKDETFYVIKGSLILEYVDKNNIFHSITLQKGQAFRIKPGIKHRFSTITLGGCKFIESSTRHEDKDSYRCHYNKKRGKWIYD